ncbi:unnamed protein product [Clonostachys byssicola]|uniref:Heterokaryon incompatibility domain-containing protein n=1 Tax=Clonostachys byssicola TaxID=160290 RepID=A0A9N9Y422_9HYPO|nr:unnamed protein product [Clonostachys byssicola]
MPVFNTYVHKPLSAPNAIRLIKLNPSVDSDSQLTCQIFEHQLSEKHVEYSAVSYTWGAQKLYQSLEIRSDDNDVSYLRTTAVVDALLRQFRAPTKPRYLWIDAICLNQNDETEKSAQVPMMGEVFQDAKAVDIWLGPENNTIPNLFAFFRALSTIPGISRWKTQLAMAKRVFLIMRQFFFDVHTALKDMMDFFNRPWFLRRWVIQEVCLARHPVVHCGNQSIPFRTVHLAAVRFQRTDMSDYAIKMVASLDSQTIHLSILELLWHFHQSDCLEKKDRIAALWSLVNPNQRFELNYNRLWTEIYHELACFLYQLNDNHISLQLLLHLFEFGPVPQSEKMSYPSWIPDWSKRRRRALPYKTRIKNTDTFEPYPCFPDQDVNVAVQFQHQGLFLHCTLDTCPHGYRVKFAATFDSGNHTDGCRSEQVVRIIRRLFPDIQNQESDLIAFASLLKSVSEFRHTDVQREQSSRCLGQFEMELINTLALSAVGFYEMLWWLRTLDSILTDFCVVEFETFAQKVDYGIGPKRMQVDDVLIPLWSVEADYHFSFISNSVVTKVPTRTSLAVRCSLGCPNTMRGGKSLAGEVIGPVVCTLKTLEADDKKGVTSDSTTDNMKRQRSWSSIQLI